MKTLNLLFIAACTVVFANLSHAQTNALTDLKNDLLNNKVTRVKILHLSYGVATFVSVTPDMLDNYDHPLWTNISGNVRTTLLKAIENTTVTASNDPGDLRWGAIFYGKNSNELHSIYLDKHYTNTQTNLGRINGHIIMVNNALIGWFEMNFVPKGEKP
jgi:hypothetical protein